MYAGLINSEETSFVTALLSTAQTKLAVALQNGNRNVIRLLFRFFAALVPTNVLYASAVIQTFGTVVQTAIGMAEQGLPAIYHSTIQTACLPMKSICYMQFYFDTGQGRPKKVERLL